MNYLQIKFQKKKKKNINKRNQKRNRNKKSDPFLAAKAS